MVYGFTDLLYAPAQSSVELRLAPLQALHDTITVCYMRIKLTHVHHTTSYMQTDVMIQQKYAHMHAMPRASKLRVVRPSFDLGGDDHFLQLQNSG